MKKIIKFIVYSAFIIGFVYCMYLTVYNPKIKNIYIENDYINIEMNSIVEKNIYCNYTISNDSPPLESKDWILAKDNKCTIKYKENYKLYIKDEDKILYSYNDNNPYLLSISIYNKNEIYIPLDGSYKLNYEIKSIGKYNKISYRIDNEKIAKINEDGSIYGIKTGETKLHIDSEGNKKTYDIIITDLINERPKNYDFKKSYLKCEIYSDEEVKKLNKILETRINDAGYKTRAGVVEAARFLVLDFPYRINYFYENGRQTRGNVDGEGRYYHKGLYLSKKNYTDLTGSSTGPKMWGCSLYSNPVERYDNNGLDCSGFVSWALLNGGFDVKDVGAGLDPKSDLTDFGKLTKLTKKIVAENTIKVGDLLHSYAAGGHIGIIIGIDKENYYVAQALWYDEVGVIISTYKRDKLPSAFTEVVYMDEYYENDGNYTEMWY